MVLHEENEKSAEFYAPVVGNRTANSIPMTALGMVVAVAVAVSVDTWDIADIADVAGIADLCYTADDMVDTVEHANMVVRVHMALPMVLLLGEYIRCSRFAYSYRQSLHVMF